MRQFVPRLPGHSGAAPSRRRGNGWIAVYDEACDRDPGCCAGSPSELSERTGAVVIAIGVEHGEVVQYLLEPGRMVDEYLSVPDQYGALPPGDAIALAANPRVVARLTGADPAAVRAAPARPPSPDLLPPPRELIASIADDDRGVRGGAAARLDGRRDHAARRRPLSLLSGASGSCSPKRRCPYETVEIDLRTGPRGCTRRIRRERCRCSRRTAGCLPESAVITEYLDERYPEPALWPADAAERAVGRLLVFRFDDFSDRTTRCGAGRTARANGSRPSSPLSTACSRA